MFQNVKKQKQIEHRQVISILKWKKENHINIRPIVVLKSKITLSLVIKICKTRNNRYI